MFGFREVEVNRMRLITLLGCIALLSSGSLLASDLDKVEKTVKSALAGSAQSQKKIDELHDAARDLVAEFKSNSIRAESLETYNRQLKEMVTSQDKELKNLVVQQSRVEETGRGLSVLLERMVKTLQRFRELDLPFLQTERNSRIINLEKMLTRADINLSEKYRKVMEAWKIESDYGNTIETYRTGLQLSDDNYRVVDHLRIGRVALFYQTLDGRESGRWNAQSKQWEVLDNKYRVSIKQGLEIAQKRAQPELLNLPMPVAQPAGKEEQS